MLRFTALLFLGATLSLGAQDVRTTGSPLQAATRLDLQLRTADARALIQSVIDTSSLPAAKAVAQRAMAMSWAFDGNCANTTKYEMVVIDYWKTREAIEPQNAFYQEGEMANEAARVCIDAGSFAEAERLYRLGSELGTKEPMPATHSRALWDFRLTHALARLAARRGDKTEAQKQVARARQILDGADSTMRAQQERFLPYLAGYVALYTNDFVTAEHELTRAVEMPGNTTDPFMRYLIGLTYEKTGRATDAQMAYDKAFSLANAHTPPSAFVHHTLGSRAIGP